MPITVGCDPEFLLKAINGNMERIPSGMHHSGSHGSIGDDHCGRVGELRPHYGSPKQVVENIRGLLAWIKERYPQYKVIAGGGAGDTYRESIGGHIHIGGLQLSLNYNSSTRWRNRYSRRSRSSSRRRIDPMASEDNRLIIALDYFIGRRLKKVSGGGRPRGSSYGRNSDIESKAHGFEYRTPPSWITDPVLAEAVLATVYRIVEIWQTKPIAFDEFWESNKSVARKADYRMLIPTSGPNVAYYRTQIANLKKVLFSKTYKMDNDNLLELWSNERELNQLYGIGQTEVAGDVQLGRRRRSTTTIQLQVCQIKEVDATQDFSQEQVLRVCRFAKPEVVIYPMQDYTPWTFSLTRDIRLRPNTIYFSKELRPFLRLKRERSFRTRFVELVRRTADYSSTEPITNAVLFNAARSDESIREEIVTIFETCARTKIKNVE